MSRDGDDGEARKGQPDSVVCVIAALMRSRNHDHDGRWLLSFYVSLDDSSGLVIGGRVAKRVVGGEACATGRCRVE